MPSYSSWRHRSASIFGGDTVDDNGQIDQQTGRPRSNSLSGSSRPPAMRSFVTAHGRVGQEIDSIENARSVRSDTAEIAAYFLNNGTTPLSTSFLARQRPSVPSSPRISSEEDRPRFPWPTTADPGTTIHALAEEGDGLSVLSNALRWSPPEVSEGNGTMKAPVVRIQKTATDDVGEDTPLLEGRSRRPTDNGEGSSNESLHNEEDLDVEGQKVISRRRSRWQHIMEWGPDLSAWKSRIQWNPPKWDRSKFLQAFILDPARCMPAVIVGVLLNILDALSYGMILFPLANPIFSKLGSAGISIFYVSTIISQLTFSSGSIFKGGVGSELIEVVPFFHNMAASITAIVGEEKPDAVIATTICAYALSSMLTGLVFFIMGNCRLGYMVGFIPRHILIGCIGGVGLFLVFTGFEVSGRLEGGVQFDYDTLAQLFDTETIYQWLIPLILAVVLFITNSMTTSRMFLPSYIMFIPAVFYILIVSIDQLDIDTLRDGGWIFTGPPASEPWWYFYTLFKFELVHWGAIVECIPAMLALTFFGVLHVPINVPALASSLNEDNVSLDHELKLHGISNFVSGCFGSIQNYLVFANTVFFQRSGGDSRLAGVLLAFCTFCVMLVGPTIIGFIPVMMVGCLIFDLGFELLVEAIWEPRKKMTPFEYLTVLTIVIVMGAYDFVIGILVGVFLAFVHLIVQTARVPAIRSIFSGAEVSSTVRRNPTHAHYLKSAGKQIVIIKLSGFLFFGTIVSVDEHIRAIIDDTAFEENPIRYIICDFRQVSGIDYSAVEAFATIGRLLLAKRVEFIVSGVEADGKIGRAMRAGDIVGGEGSPGAALLPDLNSALESCENELLKIFFARHDAMSRQHEQQLSTAPVAVPAARSVNNEFADMPANSPRRDRLHQAANESLITLQAHVRPQRWKSFAEPLRLILSIFNDISDRNEDFWFRATKHFTRRMHNTGELLYSAGEPADGFYMVEKGMIRIEYDLPQGRYTECIVPGTTCGELPFFSKTERTAGAVVESDCVIWVLTADMWKKLQREEPDVAKELLMVSLKLTSERMSSITAYTLMMGS